MCDKLELINAKMLEKFVDRKVKIYKNDCALEGICRSIDGYLNTILENAVFINKEQKIMANLKTCLVIGSTIKHINIIQ